MSPDSATLGSESPAVPQGDTRSTCCHRAPSSQTCPRNWKQADLIPILVAAFLGADSSDLGILSLQVHGCGPITVFPGGMSSNRAITSHGESQRAMVPPSSSSWGLQRLLSTSPHKTTITSHGAYKVQCPIPDHQGRPNILMPSAMWGEGGLSQIPSHSGRLKWASAGRN